MLPGTDGIQLMQTVPELADLPVVFISGYGRDETIARALEAGADDYIVKPFSPTELTARPRPAGRADVGLARLRPCVTPGTGTHVSPGCRASGLTRPSAEAIRGFGLGFVVVPFPPVRRGMV